MNLRCCETKSLSLLKMPRASPLLLIRKNCLTFRYTILVREENELFWYTLFSHYIRSSNGPNNPIVILPHRYPSGETFYDFIQIKLTLEMNFNTRLFWNRWTGWIFAIKRYSQEVKMFYQQQVSWLYQFASLQSACFDILELMCLN